MVRLILLLLLTSFVASAQSPWRVELLDSAGFTPTAMGTVENLVAVASQPEGSTFFPRTGDLRLRIYPLNHQTGDLQAPLTSLQFRGEFVANHLVGMPNLAVSRFLIAGGFHDTCYLPNDTLIGFEPLALDPFLMRVNAYSGQPEWVWHRRQAQNNYIHKINYESGQGIILASGLYDDVSGWLAAFKASNGQLLWEKAWTGARTVSDARFDPDFQGAVLFTGTIDDFGHLNNIATPLTPLPNTGYRTFLARYWPANDSVQFIATTPYITFDFEPGILTDNPVPLRTSSSSILPFLWSTPTFENGEQQLVKSVGGSASPTYIDRQLWHGHFDAASAPNPNAGPVFFTKQQPHGPLAMWLNGIEARQTAFGSIPLVKLEKPEHLVILGKKPISRLKQQGPYASKLLPEATAPFLFKGQLPLHQSGCYCTALWAWPEALQKQATLLLKSIPTQCCTMSCFWSPMAMTWAPFNGNCTICMAVVWKQASCCPMKTASNYLFYRLGYI